MNILFVAAHYYPYIGGVEYVVKSLAERLAKLGHEITVLAGEPNGRQIKEEIINEVKVIRWPTLTWKDAYHVPKKRSKLEFILKKLLKDVNVVHVHSAHAVIPVYVGIKAKKFNPGTKLIFTPHYHAHGHTLIRELAWRTLWRKYVKKIIRYANKIHAVSIVEAERLVKQYPEVKDKLVIIPNGVNEDVFQYKWKGQNSNYMIYAGRVEKYKRLEAAMDIAKELELNLFIVGEGPYKKKLMNYAEKYYQHRVKFMKYQPRKKYLELLANAKYAINLSELEAYSIFIAEALALGVPAIVSKTILRIFNTPAKPIANNIWLINKASICTWNEVTLRYLSIYKCS